MIQNWKFKGYLLFFHSYIIQICYFKNNSLAIIIKSILLKLILNSQSTPHYQCWSFLKRRSSSIICFFFFNLFSYTLLERGNYFVCEFHLSLAISGITLILVSFAYTKGRIELIMTGLVFVGFQMTYLKDLWIKLCPCRNWNILYSTNMSISKNTFVWLSFGNKIS